MWNDGKGYLMESVPGCKRNGVKQAMFVHRRVMQERIGRPLERHEHVHHIDGDPLNNDPSNLEIVSPAEHRRLHAGWQKINGIWWKPCGECGEVLSVDNFYRRGSSYQLRCKPCDLASSAQRKDSEHHRAKMRANIKRRRAERLANGTCRDCDSPRVSATRCARHLADKRQENHRKAP